MERPEMMQRNIQALYANLAARVKKGEISEEKKQILINEVAARIAKPIDINKVSGKQTWRFGDILRQGGRWQDAETVYKKAILLAKGNEDRRVNDSMQLARIEAHLGKIPEGIAIARSTFNAPSSEKGPILYSVLYEFVPEAAGKGHALEVAKLLEDAIGQHMQVDVNPNTSSGKAFLASRPIHIRKAWDQLIKIYDGAGRPDLAKKAISGAEKTLSKFGSI